jgi:hypothetical protein
MRPRFGAMIRRAAMSCCTARRRARVMLLLLRLASSLAACPYKHKHARNLEITAAEHATISAAFLAGTPAPAASHPFEIGNVYPHDIMSCPGGAALTTAHMDSALYDFVSASVVSLFDNHPTECTSAVCPRADLVGCVVRFVGHDLMDYRSSGGVSSGGADGCVAFADVDNVLVGPGSNPPLGGDESVCEECHRQSRRSFARCVDSVALRAA